MGTKTEKEKIIRENLKLYRLESKNYISLHPEIYNWFEQRETERDLRYIGEKIERKDALDVGCGTGNLALKLLSLGFSVTALDISTSMIKEAKNTLTEDTASRLTIIESDIDNFLSGKKREYSLVSMSSVLHHLPNYLETLENLVEIISFGGFLYITHEPLKDVLIQRDSIFRKILWQIDYLCYLIKGRGRIESINGVNWRLSDYHLYKGLKHEKVKSLLTEKGFKVDFRKYSSAMRLGISNWVDNKLLKSETQFKIIAEKNRV
jgi:ubiquinone/menaquinone biosynthesis C-methylase UbiE